MKIERTDAIHDCLTLIDYISPLGSATRGVALCRMTKWRRKP